MNCYGFEPLRWAHVRESCRIPCGIVENPLENEGFSRCVIKFLAPPNGNDRWFLELPIVPQNPSKPLETKQNRNSGMGRNSVIHFMRREGVGVHAHLICSPASPARLPARGNTRVASARVLVNSNSTTPTPATMTRTTEPRGVLALPFLPQSVHRFNSRD